MQLLVTFALAKQWAPNLTYAELKQAFATQENITAQDIFKKVCDIRQSKLPDPKMMGNAGSFFHNPVVDDARYQELKNQFPHLIAHRVTNSAASLTTANSGWKLAAGWMIDQCGLKGFRQGSVGVYEKQALVLVNHGGGTGQELLNLAATIQERVLEKFGVNLTIEPVVIS